MHPTFKIFRNISNPSLYRVIFSSNSFIWRYLKIYELQYSNFQVQRKCIANDADMNFNCKGRIIYVNTVVLTPPEWKEVSLDILKCATCEKSVCPSTCATLNEFLHFSS